MGHQKGWAPSPDCPGTLPLWPLWTGPKAHSVTDTPCSRANSQHYFQPVYHLTCIFDPSCTRRLYYWSISGNRNNKQPHASNCNFLVTHQICRNILHSSTTKARHFIPPWYRGNTQPAHYIQDTQHKHERLYLTWSVWLAKVRYTQWDGYEGYQLSVCHPSFALCSFACHVSRLGMLKDPQGYLKRGSIRPPEDGVMITSKEVLLVIVEKNLCRFGSIGAWANIFDREASRFRRRGAGLRSDGEMQWSSSFCQWCHFNFSHVTIPKF